MRQVPAYSLKQARGTKSQFNHASECIQDEMEHCTLPTNSILSKYQITSIKQLVTDLRMYQVYGSYNSIDYVILNVPLKSQFMQISSNFRGGFSSNLFVISFTIAYMPSVIQIHVISSIKSTLGQRTAKS